MKKLSAFAVITAMGIASAANAGGPGPVIIEDAPVVVEDAGSSSGSLGGSGLLIALGALAVVAAIAASSNNS